MQSREVSLWRETSIFFRQFKQQQQQTQKQPYTNEVHFMHNAREFEWIHNIFQMKRTNTNQVTLTQN